MDFIHGSIVVCKFFLVQLVKAPALMETSLNFRNNINFTALAENKHRKFFVFKDKLFSRVEVLGRVVKTITKNDKVTFELDDSTATMFAYVWTTNKFISQERIQKIV